MVPHSLKFLLGFQLLFFLFAFNLNFKSYPFFFLTLTWGYVYWLERERQTSMWERNINRLQTRDRTHTEVMWPNREWNLQTSGPINSAARPGLNPLRLSSKVYLSIQSYTLLTHSNLFLKVYYIHLEMIMYCAAVEIYLTLVLQWSCHIGMHFKVSKGKNYIYSNSWIPTS